MHLDRHQFVYLDPAAWAAIVGKRQDVKEIPAVAEWGMLHRPLIARRPMCGDGAGTLPLGLALPASMGKQRLAFVASPAAVVSTTLPPRLADVAAIIPAAWQTTVAELVALDCHVRCFGSLAWEFLTGLPYLTATSDLDLVWRASTAEGANAIATAIGQIEAKSPARIDGEIVTRGGIAIHWLEWASGSPEVLAKGREGNRLIARKAVFA